MKKIFLFLIDGIVFAKIVPVILCFYEKRLMYRIKNAWGIANMKHVAKVGENVRFVGYSRILAGENIEIGNNVRIGYGCFFFGVGGIKIGNNTIFSRNITIYTANHDYKSNFVPYDNNYIKKSVIIGDGVWIGMGVSITPGVTIGDGAIIGMGTVVSKDVEPGAIVVGADQKTVLRRDMDMFYENQKNDRIFARHWPDN